MIEKLKDKYRIIRSIGSGGMAEIFLAEDLIDGKRVAIKIINSDKAKDYATQKRFKSEIELTKKIDSPYVVKYIEGVWNDDIQYIVLEYIEGSILRNYISERMRLSVEETVEFAKQMALGFGKIHEYGIFHRDIKSQNIMVAPFGRIKIIDFGIALEKNSERLTQTGNLIASPQYIAPELVKQTAQPNAQTDIYALGILIYEMLSGNVPFKEATPLDTAIKHTTTDVPRINKIFPNVPNSVANIIAKATFKDTNYRYKSMYDLYKDLDVALTREKMNEPDYNPLAKKKRSLREIVNSKWFLIGLVAVIIILLVAVIVAILFVFVIGK